MNWVGPSHVLTWCGVYALNSRRIVFKQPSRISRARPSASGNLVLCGTWPLCERNEKGEERGRVWVESLQPATTALS